MKFVNAGNASLVLDVKLDVAHDSVNGTTMHAKETVDVEIQFEGSMAPRPIADLERAWAQENDSKECFRWDVPAWSVNVIQFNLAESDQT